MGRRALVKKLQYQSTRVPDRLGRKLTSWANTPSRVVATYDAFGRKPCPPREASVLYVALLGEGREAAHYRRLVVDAAGVVPRICPVGESQGAGGTHPLVSAAVKEALKETRDAVATCPRPSGR